MACSSCLAFACGIEAFSENRLVDSENGRQPDLPVLQRRFQ